MNRENFTQPFVGLTFTQSKPSYMLTFHKEGNKVGSFDFNEGQMHFEGDVSESGQIFVDWVLSSFKQRINDAVLAEREACAKLCEEMRTYVGRNNAVTQSSAQDCAAAIRARGPKPPDLV